MVDTRKAVSAVLDTHAPPDVRQIRHELQASPQHVTQSPRPFREDLVGMPVGGGHDPRDAQDVVLRDVFVEEVAHRIDEDHPRPRPTHGLAKLLGNKAEVEAAFVWMPRDPAKPLGEGLGVAVCTPRADLRAAAHGIPSRVGPLDFRTTAHDLGSLARANCSVRMYNQASEISCGRRISTWGASLRPGQFISSAARV